MTLLDQTTSWGVRTATVGVTTPRQTVDIMGRSNNPFPLASVTKPLFAFACLVAWEEGSIGLDDVVGPTGASVQELLAHGAGLAPERDENGNATALGAPRRNRIYSNAGFEILGDHLRDRTGFEVADYLTEAVCGPLGMTETALSGSPAHAAVSTLDDLLAFARELLTPTLISAETMRVARTPVFPQLAGVLPGFGRQTPNPWGLGFEIRGEKSPHWTGRTNSPETFGHFGRSGTFIWVDPAIDLACVTLTDRDFGPWAAEAWPVLSDEVIATHRPG